MWVLFRRICAPIFMQPPINLSKPWVNLSRQQTQIILLIGFLLWTSFLVIETVNLQYPCTPMISWTQKLPDQCSFHLSDGNDTKKEFKKTHPKTTKPEPKKTIVKVKKVEKIDVVKLIQKHPEVLVSAVVTGIGAIAGAPILVIVGIGIGILSIGSQVLNFFK
jgi:hypothetical protein